MYGWYSSYLAQLTADGLSLPITTYSRGLLGSLFAQPWKTGGNVGSFNAVEEAVMFQTAGPRNHDVLGLTSNPSEPRSVGPDHPEEGGKKNLRMMKLLPVSSSLVPEPKVSELLPLRVKLHLNELCLLHLKLNATHSLQVIANHNVGENLLKLLNN
ncbi:uncharacterized protein LOC124293233 isoform X2 [Neodiprion lecontei]|uniref:Uncharacterized protein LOC124293233 isoform X2 n=1 Tax=Neodiprion lecontei TaxID=441921 RepID=A0ABM3FMK7_NEOLC|nr:uncharacterized protein LOC124293233 isoform X2 [Neodiprion lecontei]